MSKSKIQFVCFLTIGSLILVSGFILLRTVALADLAAGEKEIGVYQEDDFVPKDTFQVDDEAVIRLTVRGGKGKQRNKPDIMLVMDSSGSMRWGWDGRYDYSPPWKIDSAKVALKAFVDAADPDYDRVGFATYSSWGTLGEPLTNDFEILKQKIDSMDAVGTTSIGAGLEVANLQLESNSRTGSPRYVILATDGQQNKFPSVYDNGILDKSVALGAVVYTVGIGNDVNGADDMICPPCAAQGVHNGRQYLEDIASKTGGQYYFADSEERLREIYGKLKEEIEFTFDVYIQDTLSSPYYSVLEIDKVTDGEGNLADHDLNISGNTISGGLGVYSAGEERIIYLKAQINGGAGTGPWTVYVDDEEEENKVVYKDLDGNVISEHEISNIEITIERLCDNSPPSGLSSNQCALIPTWSWAAPADADRYHIQVSRDVGFNDIVAEDADLTGTTFILDPLPAGISRGDVIFFRVKAHNTCDKWSGWSSDSGNLAPVKIDKPLDNVSNPVTVQPLDTGFGTADRDITVVFDSASSGTIVFTYTITRADGSVEPHEKNDYTFSWDGDPYNSEFWTFNSINLNPGDSVVARAQVEAHNSPPAPSCGSSSATEGVTINIPDWIQAIDGDVYSSYDPDPLVDDGPGISVYVYESPLYDPGTGYFEPYFLVAKYTSPVGGIIQAKEDIECAVPCISQDMINERLWSSADYQGAIDWPKEIIKKAADAADGHFIYHVGSLDITDLGPLYVFEDRPKIVIVDNDIIISDVQDSGVGVGKTIYGIYIAGGRIRFDTSQTFYSEPAFIIGALYAGRGFDLENRELNNNEEPAIVVEFDPSYLIEPLPSLSRFEYSWEEVVPR